LLAYSIGRAVPTRLPMMIEQTVMVGGVLHTSWAAHAICQRASSHTETLPTHLCPLIVII